MPLVRYRTGDLIRLPTAFGARELDEIVSGRRGFEGVIGRTNDVLIDATGTRVLTGVNQIPRGVERLLRLQVLQETPRSVVLRVLPGPGFGAADAQKLLHNARLKIPVAVDVQVQIASDLQKTERGKTPFVIHSPAVKEALRNAVVGTIAA
jgi:phenylacetate-coenzyme A ligase PaaK-like adenylate-forming protein